MRGSIVGLLAIAGIALVGCRDGSTPLRGIEIRVSPDTVRADPSSRTVVILFTVSNTTTSDLVYSYRPDVESEQPSGAWTTVADSLALYIQPALGGSLVQRGATVNGIQSRTLVPGRYRIHASYWKNDTQGVTVPGTSRDAVSNVFTVLP